MNGRLDLNLMFGDPHLPARLEALSPGALDALPFGVVLLDGKDRVVLTNSVERSRTGMANDVIGRDFFQDVASFYADTPVPGFVRAVRNGRERADGDTPLDLDELVGVMTGAVKVRVDSATSGGLWIVLDRGTGPLSAAEDGRRPLS